MTRATLLALVLFAACGAPGEGVGNGVTEGIPTESQGVPEVQGFTDDEVRALLELSPLPPVPPDPTNRVSDDPRAARLGQYVFFDPRFSRDGKISCATCHDPRQGWADGKPLAEGLATLDRHTMTLWNTAHQRWFFWDGRADSLWAQATQPFEEPREHGISRERVIAAFRDDLALSEAYGRLFGPLPAEGASAAELDRAYANVAKCIAAFERRIVAGRSDFDVFVEGVRRGDLYQQLSLGEAARRGLRLFLGKANCVVCHSGPLFSDREFHDNRVPPRGGGKRLDAGRYDGIERVQNDPFNGTGAFSDAPRGPSEDKVAYLLRAGHTWSEFKTPSLRNVAVTAPYMHQGQLATLEEVVAFYDTLEGAAETHHQAERILQPLDLTPEERADLVEFLVSLTDVRLDPSLTQQPESP